jgi:hypothetical protein
MSRVEEREQGGLQQAMTVARSLSFSLRSPVGHRVLPAAATHRNRQGPVQLSRKQSNNLYAIRCRPIRARSRGRGRKTATRFLPSWPLASAPSSRPGPVKQPPPDGSGDPAGDGKPPAPAPLRFADPGVRVPARSPSTAVHEDEVTACSVPSAKLSDNTSDAIAVPMKSCFMENDSDACHA